MVIMIAVYIPPQVDTDVALSALHDLLCAIQNRHPDTVVTMMGDFNRANFKHVTPNFYQHVTLAEEQTH